MKRSLIIILLIMCCCLGSCSKNNGVYKSNEIVEKSEKVTANSSEENYNIDLSNIYYSKDGSEAKVSKLTDNKWEISYHTPDGNVVGSFLTKWTKNGDEKYSSESKMEKSDGYTEFIISINRDGGVISITISDGNADHEMVFTSEKVEITPSTDNPILKGDLSEFEGKYSNDQMEQGIVDANYNLYGYNKQEYQGNSANAFPRITFYNNEWYFWSGSIKANYKLNSEKLPKKVNNYYEVYFRGENSVAIKGQELVLTLVPKNAEGPDRKTAEENRLFWGQNTSIIFREYHDKWWENYEKTSPAKDLDIAAIDNGDITSLVGTWKNGKGDTLVINSDGSTSIGMNVKSRKDSSQISKVPFANLVRGHSGAALGLYKIGFRNPQGDQSDASKARLIITQNAGNYPAENYYYRED